MNTIEQSWTEHVLAYWRQVLILQAGTAGFRVMNRPDRIEYEENDALILTEHVENGLSYGLGDQVSHQKGFGLSPWGLRSSDAYTIGVSTAAHFRVIAFVKLRGRNKMIGKERFKIESTFAVLVTDFPDTHSLLTVEGKVGLVWVGALDKVPDLPTLPDIS